MKLASIEIIKEVKALPDSDRLDLVYVLGYQCVTERGLYKEGDIICYIQPDTLLPIAEWTDGYRKYAPQRIKAIKLRKYWSEGIIVPLDLIQDKLHSDIEVGTEVSELIGITKYEPPVPQDNSAQRYIPIPKTDEERWENLDSNLPFGELCDVTLKIDGTSFSAYKLLHEEGVHIAGRTLEFKKTSNNNHTRFAEKYKVAEKLEALCQKHNRSISVRGEIYGNGIQSGSHNPHSVLEKDLAIFSVYLPDENGYANKGHELYFSELCEELGLPTVPILEKDVVLTEELIQKYSSGLKKLDGKNFEGVVIKHSQGSFKVINKHYDSLK